MKYVRFCSTILTTKKDVITMDIIKYEKLTLEITSDKLGYVITECEKDAIDVIIPKMVEGLPVVKIEDYAFSECKDLISVKFPEYDMNDYINDNLLREIGEYAFSHCYSLEEIEIPEYVYTIKWGTFYNCKSLKKASYSTNTYVGSYAFYNCKNLVEVSSTNEIGEGAFSHCESLNYFPLINGTTSIEEDSFEHCDSLTEITIPATVNSIGKLAFRGCANLKSVHFENTSNWYWQNRYTGEDVEIDVSNPEKMAKWLSGMDFDDGVGTLFKK